MEKVWLKNYPKGVVEEINTDQFESIPDLFLDCIERYRYHPAFSCMGKDMSYAELEKQSKDFAAFLQNRLGLEKGQRIAIMSPNILQYPIALMGALRAGLIVVNVNPLYTERELKHQLTDSGAEAIVIVANFAHTLEAVIEDTNVKHVILTELGDLLGFPKSLLVNSVVKYVKKMVPKFSLRQAYKFNDVLAEGSKLSFRPVKVESDDIAFLQYTGGTTGVAKGAMLTNKNMVSNMLQIYHWMKNDLKEGQEIIATPLPLYHIFSLTVNCLGFMHMGAKNVLITNPRDIPGFIKIIKNSYITVMSGVNTLFVALMNQILNKFFFKC